MLSLLLVASLAATDAKPEPTFCERMATVWTMGQKSRGKDLFYFAKLKGGSQHRVSYTYTGNESAALTEKLCRRKLHFAACDLLGPGVLMIDTGRFTRRFEVKPGERARFASNVHHVNCTDLPAGAVRGGS